jgi:hypothetical protein
LKDPCDLVRYFKLLYRPNRIGNVVILCLLISTSHAQPIDHTQTISKLLKIDSLRAMNVSEINIAYPTHVQDSYPPDTSNFRAEDLINDCDRKSPRRNDGLTAIYGVGKSLVAEVTSGPNKQIYKLGHKQPVFGFQSGDELVNIVPPCIELREKEILKRFCLEIK